MTIIDSDHAVTFTVQPPRLTDDLVLIEHTKRGVAQCTPDQRYALTWALAQYNDARASVAPTYTASPPARRQPSWAEVVRGVQCCDPAVRDQWRVFRVCLLTLGLIVLVASAAAVVFGSVGVGIVLVAVFAVCAVASKGITGGKASVCH